MRSIKLTLFGFIVFTLFYILQSDSFAQVSSNSPYSNYGIGEINAKGFASNFAMGGTYIAVQNDSTPNHFINSGNPASYANTFLTTVEVGANVNVLTQKTATAKESLLSGSIGYVSVAIPVKKWWGSCIGLRPYSVVGYNINASQTVDTVTINNGYQGKGGLNQAYFGNGFKPLYFLPDKFLKSKKYKRLSEEKKDSVINKILKRRQAWQGLFIGANLSYLFGSITNTETSVFPSGLNAFNTSINSTTYLDKLSFDYGLQYSYTFDSLNGRDLKDNFTILFGATFSAKTNLNARIDSLTYNYFTSPYGQNIVQDTIVNSGNTKSKIALPLSFGFGLGFRKGEKWLVAADYAFQNWSSYTAFGQSQGFKNSMRISLGGQYIPNSESNNYFKRISYRFGVRYAQTMIVIQDYQITEQAISFGLGLPAGNVRLTQSFSMINIGAEVGTLGTTADGLVQELFFKINIGGTINDKWFVKRKID